MTRPTVLLVFGGESSEHDVSVSSARNIYAALDGEKYDTKLCYIDHHGKWWLLDEWSESLSRHGGVQLVAAPGSGSFMTIPGSAIVHVDVLFPALHGKNGEDGTVQGLAKLLGIAVVGSGVTASALCMDKLLTKQVLLANGVKTAKYQVYRRGSAYPNYEEIAETLGEVVFVKPTCSGSSVGTTKVHTVREFLPALKDALEHDDNVLIEEYIEGRELEVAVLGNTPKQRVSGVGEVVTSADFYDYNEKYVDTGNTQILTNVTLPDGLQQKIDDTTRQVYELLGCQGMARVDYLLKGTTLYIMEVNTLPGFTSTSMYPKLWRAAGTSYAQLVDELIAAAQQR